MTDLTPQQQRVLDDLFLVGRPRPSFSADLHRELLREIKEGVAEVAELLQTAGKSVFVNKNALDRIHACERHYVAEKASPFRWTPSRARGVVAHRAVEMGMFAEPPHPPRDLVDAAVAHYEAEGDDYSPGPWLREQATAEERAELRMEATTMATTLAESFPPLKARWKPRVESPLTVRVITDVITLSARPDLMLGVPEGTTAKTLVVDFKTGRSAAAHLDDARFYALLVTLRTGVPPFRSASFYLDSGDWTAVDVTEDDLASAARRTVAGTIALGDLAAGGRAPTATAGPMCRFCVIRDSCDVGLEAARQREAQASDDGIDGDGAFGSGPPF